MNTTLSPVQKYHRDILTAHLSELLDELDKIDKLNLATVLLLWLTYDTAVKQWGGFGHDLDDTMYPLDPTLEFQNCLDLLIDIEPTPKEGQKLVQKLIQQLEV